MQNIYLKILSLFNKYLTMGGYDVRDSVLNPIIKEYKPLQMCETTFDTNDVVYGYKFIWNNTDIDFQGLKPSHFGIWYNQSLIKQFRIRIKDYKVHLGDINKIKKWFDKRFSTLFQRIIKNPIYIVTSIAIIQIITSFSYELGKYLFNSFFN